MNLPFGSINIDSLVSDPMLLIGVSLFVIGILVFSVSIWKLLSFNKSSSFEIPEEPSIEELSVTSSATEEEPSNPATQRASASPTVNHVDDVLEQISAIETANSTAHTLAETLSDKTVVMPNGMSDLQAQMDIMLAQIKQLNKKVSDIEDSFDDIAKQVNGKLEVNELKEIPMNPQDFTQKLLKLAEHVIVLEKEMAKLRLSGKLPLMPL